MTRRMHVKNLAPLQMSLLSWNVVPPAWKSPEVKKAPAAG